MDSSPSFRSPQPHGSPLIAISPERINQQRNAHSPSKSTEQSHYQSPSKGTAGVQSKVAFLNGLARNNSPSPGPVFQSSTTSAALQRAILGREEAESALEGAASQLSEARTRERKISERVESLLEELQSVKKHQSHERAVFEKEVRKARKEAFRAGSNVVKAQEELKSSKSEIKGLRDELNEEREAKDQAKQEAFENEYKLAGVTEELTALKEQFRSLEAKSHTDELEAKAEEIREKTPEAGPVLGEVKGKVPDPVTPTAKSEEEEEMVCPSTRTALRSIRRRRADSPSLRLLHKPDVVFPDIDTYKQITELKDIDPGYVEDLRIDFKLERKERLRAEDTIKMMNMECQFLSCACRRAERRGERYVFDFEYDRKLQEQEKQRRQKEECEDSQESNASGPQAQEDKASSQPPGEDDVPMKDTETHEFQQEESLITFSPNTGTFHAVPQENSTRSEPREPGWEGSVHTGDLSYEQPSTPRPAPPPQGFSPDLTMEDAHPSQPFEHSAAHIQPQSPFVSNPPSLTNPKTPSRPSSKNGGIPIKREQATSNHNHNNNPRHNTPAVTETVTTTTTVPLHSENREKSSDPSATIPGTPVTRQEALAQIKARRGRARSNTNRSVSASEMNSRPPSRAPSRPPSRVPSRPPSRARAVTPVRKGRRTPTATGQGDRNPDRVRKVTNPKDRRHISAPGRC